MIYVELILLIVQISMFINKDIMIKCILCVKNVERNLQHLMTFRHILNDMK